jgi:hypothetical protein
LSKRGVYWLGWILGWVGCKSLLLGEIRCCWVRIAVVECEFLLVSPFTVVGPIPAVVGLIHRQWPPDRSVGLWLLGRTVNVGRLSLLAFFIWVGLLMSALGMVALDTSVSKMERAKKGENEPRHLSWFSFWTHLMGPLVVLPPQILLTTKTSRPHPKGRGGVAGVARRARWSSGG